MKKLFTLLAICFSSTAFLQSNVLNPNFENWEDEVVFDSLEFWTTSATQMYLSGFDPNTWQDDFDPQDGDYSVYMETVFAYNEGTGEDDTIFGYCVQGETSGSSFKGVPYTDTVDQFTFWYKCEVEPGDSAVAIIQLSKGGTVYASAIYKMGGTTADWTEVSVPIFAGETEEPDSLWIGFASSDPFTAGVPEEGSVLEIDLVTLEYTAGTDVPTPLENNSFEDLFEETIELAQDWEAFNALLYLYGLENYVEKSTDASNGTSSMQITTTATNIAFDIPALVTNGEFDLGTGLPLDGDEFIAQPEYMLLDFQYAPTGLDTALCWLQIWNGGGALVDTFVIYTNTVASWTTDTIELSFSSAPDSINIVLYSGNQLGSEFKVDHIRFEGGDVGINPLNLFDTWSLFPNPSNDVATVNFKEADRISVMNLAGQEIYQTNTFNSTTLQLNTADWTDGIYIVQLINNGVVQTKKLVVAH